MSPCSPLDVSFDIPDGPSGPAIPGFGIPFALNLPEINEVNRIKQNRSNRSLLSSC